MKAGFTPVLLLLVFAGGNLACGQQAVTNVNSANNTMSLHQGTPAKPQESTPMVLRLTEPKDTNSMQFQFSKTTRVRLGGPVIQPLKAKTASGFASRVAAWFNPLSRAAPNVPVAPAGPVNTRAWSTLVGWNPGRSAFPDGAWHEPPHLDLISITAEKQP